MDDEPGPKHNPPDLDWSERDEAFEELGTYIDICFRAEDRRGTERALDEIETAPVEKWPPQARGRLLYMKANALLDYHRAKRRSQEMTEGEVGKPDDVDGEERSTEERSSGEDGTRIGIWNWRQPGYRKQVLHLRVALQELGQADNPGPWLVRSLTNLGNGMAHLGRYIEAIEFWNRALEIEPDHGMARGNRGWGFLNYSRTIYNDYHRAIFIAACLQDLEMALQDPSRLEPEARAGFSPMAKTLAENVELTSPDEIDDVPVEYLGDTEDERDYRRWCLENRLFLNPLNDIKDWRMAGEDVLLLPTIIASNFQPEEWIALYNQIKQEYTSARFLLYEGLRSGSEDTHPSDRSVVLLNTPDYDIYGLGIEKIKLAYRSAYSLFDKIAYLLNDYLELGLKKYRVSFRRVWYKGGHRSNGLHPTLQGRRNWPLRGLFWLSRDLYEEGEYQDAMLPDARELVEIRRSSEHRLLRIHRPWASDLVNDGSEDSPRQKDPLGYSIALPDLKGRALRLMKMARAGIMYLSFAIESEERGKREERDSEEGVVTMPTDTYEDDWKRPSL